MISACLLTATLLTAEPSAWAVKDTKDGMTLSTRELPNERVVEIKVVATSALPVATLCLQAYGSATIGKDEPALTARKLIREGNNERVTYDQVTSPVVSDRDYAVHAVYTPDTGNGGCRVKFDVDNAEAPILPKGFVRIEKLRGQWDFVATDKGTAITYVIFTDPAGAVPAFLVEGPRRDTAFAAVKRVLTRAKNAWLPDGGRD